MENLSQILGLTDDTATKHLDSIDGTLQRIYATQIDEEREEKQEALKEKTFRERIIAEKNRAKSDPQMPMSAFSNEKERRGNKTWLWTILGLGLIGGGATAAWLNRDKIAEGIQDAFKWAGEQILKFDFLSLFKGLLDVALNNPLATGTLVGGVATGLWAANKLRNRGIKSPGTKNTRVTKPPTRLKPKTKPVRLKPKGPPKIKPPKGFQTKATKKIATDLAKKGATRTAAGTAGKLISGLNAFTLMWTASDLAHMGLDAIVANKLSKSVESREKTLAVWKKKLQEEAEYETTLGHKVEKVINFGGKTTGQKQGMQIYNWMIQNDIDPKEVMKDWEVPYHVRQKLDKKQEGGVINVKPEPRNLSYLYPQTQHKQKGGTIKHTSPIQNKNLGGMISNVTTPVQNTWSSTSNYVKEQSFVGDENKNANWIGMIRNMFSGLKSFFSGIKSGPIGNMFGNMFGGGTSNVSGNMFGKMNFGETNSTVSPKGAPDTPGPSTGNSSHQASVKYHKSHLSVPNVSSPGAKFPIGDHNKILDIKAQNHGHKIVYVDMPTESKKTVTGGTKAPSFVPTTGLNIVDIQQAYNRASGVKF